MFLFTTVLHIMLCVILILVILLQPGKGSDIGAAFGGGGASSTVFGPRGAGSLLTQATTVVAVLFMFTSITLAIYSDQEAAGGGKIEDELLESSLDEFDWGLPTEETQETEAPLPVEFPSAVEDAANDVIAPEDAETESGTEEGTAQ
jgi:preprotein translocase subunit SecG